MSCSGRHEVERLQGRLSITGRPSIACLAQAYIRLLNLSRLTDVYVAAYVRTASVAAETVSAHGETSHELSGPAQ